MAGRPGRSWCCCSPAVAAEPGARRRLDYPRRLEDRLVRGDEVGVWTVIQGALASGVDADELYLEVIAPALWSIGDGWASGRVSVAEEHQASAVASRLIGDSGRCSAGRAARRAPSWSAHPPAITTACRARSSPTCSASGTWMSSTSAATPRPSRSSTRRRAPTVWSPSGCADHPRQLVNVRDAVTALHGAVAVPVVLGGSAADAGALATTGADEVTQSAEHAVARFEQLADDAAKARRRASRRG